MEFKVGIEKDLEHLNNITPLPMKDRKVEELSATEQNKVILQIAKTPFSRWRLRIRDKIRMVLCFQQGATLVEGNWKAERIQKVDYSKL